MYRKPDLKRHLPDGDPLITLDDMQEMNEILLTDAINQYRANRAAAKGDK